jgi:hypothetical protein
LPHRALAREALIDQVQAVKEPSRHEKIREAIMRITDQQPPAEREAIVLSWSGPLLVVVEAALLTPT